MQKSKLMVAVLGALIAAPAMADSPWSGNVTLASQYLYRGIPQTDGGGAIQGGFDYADPSGFYIGTWASNISWLYTVQGYTGASSLEIDTYAGYSGSFAKDFSYDVGILRYNYGGTRNTATVVNADTNELYGKIGWKTISVKYSRSTGNLFGFADSSGSGYLQVDGSYSFPVVDVSAHYGHQSITGAVNTGLSYSDYNVAVSKDFGGYTVSVMASKTNYTGDKTRGVLSVSHSM